MPKIFTSNSQKIGEIGENIACTFLVKHGFDVKERNYTKKWGEIDVIAEKNNRIYFIEVKSVSCETLPIVSHETPKSNKSEGEYRPEDNMHPWKLKRLSRTIQTYLLSNSKFDNKEWQLDLLCVFLDIKNRKARIKILSDIIL